MRRMDKEVLIHVRGLQTMDADGEQEPLEIVVPGQYYFRNGSHYLRYEEVMEDFAEPTVNYIKISRKGMEVRKKGVVNVHMVFEQGKKNMTYYTTPYGTIEMGIAATFGPIACIRRKFVGSASAPTFWDTRAAIGTADTPAEPISGLIFP